MTHLGQILGPDARAKVSWRISSYSNNAGGSCVEVGGVSDATDRVAVRHSHHPNGLALVVGQPTWAAFIGGVKHGELAP
jgi:Domain of unknown function (DUF397)